MIVIDQAILDALEHYPFSSLQELVGFTCIPTTTVHRPLMQSFGFMAKHLRWVPHTITPTHETERTTLSIELLRRLRSIEHHGTITLLTKYTIVKDVSCDNTSNLANSFGLKKIISIDFLAPNV
jgi:hypothetical protein